MYQFPDSPDNLNDVIHKADLEQTKKPFKTILIANFILAVFIASIVWFLFFFDSKPSTTISNLPLSQISDPKLSRNSPPIILVEDNDKLKNASSKQLTQESNIQLINNTEQKIAEKNIIKTSTSASIAKAPRNISAIDAITRELEKTQLKNKVKNRNTTIQNNDDSDIGNQPKTSEELAKNQIIVEEATNITLKNLLLKTKKNINKNEQSLINKIETSINPANNKKEKTSNSDIHNSISLQKSNDIDKILAAMGSAKKSPQAVTIENIENKVGKLLNNEEKKYRKTDKYVGNLALEATLNNNEMRIITVKSGESIWDVAVRAYGDGKKYKKILDANPLIKKDPSSLKAGITLRVPM